ncbi:nucleoside hydrolase [Enemella evansiae]|nr:nucleoside hydrolase [Enemella evansiae]
MPVPPGGHVTDDPTRTPVIIDTDPGVDDLLALWAAYGCDRLEVRAVTTSYGNVPGSMTRENAIRALTRLGERSADTLLGRGAERPLVEPGADPIHDIHGTDGLGGAADLLPLPDRLPAPVPASTVHARVLESTDRPVTIIALGPLTNVAITLAARPDLRERIERIVMMGGGDGRGNTTAAAEFNLSCDPEAAERVFSDAVPVTMVGLDLTQSITFDESWLAELAASSQTGDLAARISRSYLAEQRARGRTGMALHDAVAVAALVRPELFSTRHVRVQVDHEHGAGRGATFLDPRDRPELDGRAVVTHVRAGDAPSVIDWVADSIAALG